MNIEQTANQEVLDDEKSQGKWYVINCYSGHEFKVRDDLVQRVESLNVTKYIFDVRVVAEQVMSKRTKKMINKNLYPGYIFVNMIMDDEAWYVIRNTPGVTGFIGSSGKGVKPFPLTEKEVKKMIHRSSEKDAASIKKNKKSSEFDFKTGQYIKVLSGAFEGYGGKIIAIDDNRGNVTINVEVFGRLTPVEIEFENCQKLD